MSIKIPLLRLESVLPSSPSHVTRFCDFAVPADSSCLVTTPLVPDADKQRGCSANHGSIGDSWPIAFSGCPRGPRVGCETRCPKHTAPNLSAETRSRTRVSREPDGPHQRRSPGWSGLGRRHSSCLWFQILGVETYPLLPDMQSDRRNLTRQRQTRHFRPNPLNQQRRVKLLERTGLVGGAVG